MFSKIILAISVLFVVVNGAKYRVQNQNLRKVSTKQKIKAVEMIKAPIQSVKKNKQNGKLAKTLADVKNLKTWNNYDSSFNSKFWTNTVLYTTTDCSGGAVSQYNEYSSDCYVGTITGSNNQTYGSAQQLFNDACTQTTIAFYASSDCTGTPAQQGNTGAISGAGTCQITTGGDDDDDDDGGISYQSGKFTCTASKSDWDGGDALVISTFEQTSTCSNDATEYAYVLGGCYPSGTGSVQYSSGPTVSTYDSTDCSGTAATVVSFSGCSADDDDGDDDDNVEDDNLIDDGMITDVDGNEDSSTSLAWSGASSTEVLNYSLSAALLVFCTLFL